jgi:MOSC domain-containing protein YiiM
VSLPQTPLLAVLAGRIEPLGDDGRTSAIRKQPVARRLQVGAQGLRVDTQADRRNHGGVDKALHHYPHEHYAAWRLELPDQAALFETGGFGENLSTEGLAEADVCVGDLFRVGSALIQVSQGRSPCWKLNVRFGVEDMARRVQACGRTGWYYRVREPGEIGAGDVLSLLERPCPEWSVARVHQALYGDAPDKDTLAALALLPQLASGWRDKAGKRLDEGKPEDWAGRLARMFGK